MSLAMMLSPLCGYVSNLNSLGLKSVPTFCELQIPLNNSAKNCDFLSLIFFFCNAGIFYLNIGSSVPKLWITSLLKYSDNA